MKNITCIIFFAALMVDLTLSNHKAQAGLYDAPCFKTGLKHEISRREKVGTKVRIRYRRRFGRRYDRRISYFVRFGPYASRRSLRKRSRRKRW